MQDEQSAIGIQAPQLRSCTQLAQQGQSLCCFHKSCSLHANMQVVWGLDPGVSPSQGFDYQQQHSTT